MLSINNIPFKGYVRYGLNQIKTILNPKQNVQMPFRDVIPLFKKEVADTME